MMKLFIHYFRGKKKQAVLIVVVIKIVISFFFSSSYFSDLFAPFIEHFSTHFDNSYLYFANQGELNKFPYPPLMLYFFTPFGILQSIIPNETLSLFLLKLPLFLFDLGTFYALYHLFGKKFYETFIFYFCSPIVFYICYVHSQLDIVPTYFLVLSLLFLIKKRPFLSFVLIGIAISTKFHVFAALPLWLIYEYRKRGVRNAVKGLGIALAIVFVSLIPFFWLEGFQEMVLFNKEQKQLTDFVISIEGLTIYLTPLAMALIYFRFYLYKKINNDLMLGYIGLTFSLFAMFTLPSPGWYLWFFPFIINLPIKQNIGRDTSTRLFAVLSIFYLIYFILLYQKGSYYNILFLSQPLDIVFQNEIVSNIVFSMLWGTLGLVVYVSYNFSIKSNSIYKNKSVPHLIGISGDSGSGKTTILSDIKELLGKRILHLEGDGDHKWERGDDNWNVLTHLDPKANYLHKQADNLLHLKMGYDTYRRDYDHATGRFTSDLKLKPQDYVVICGLHAFYLPKVRRLIDFKVFVNTEERLRVHWKMVRDIKNRGYTKEEILDQINKRKEDCDKFVLPQKNFADLVVRYFTTDEFEVGTLDYEPKLSLKLSLNSNIDLDALVDLMIARNYSIKWDYSDDMSNQVLTFCDSTNITEAEIVQIAQHLIVNYEEIIENNSFWKGGYRGIIQLIIILVIIEDKKKDYIDDVI